MKRKSGIFFLFFVVLLVCIFPAEAKAYVDDDDITLRANTEYTIRIDGEGCLCINAKLKVDNEVFIKIYDVVTDYIVYTNGDYENGVAHSDKSMNYLTIDLDDGYLDDGIYYLKHGSDSIQIEEFFYRGENEFYIDNNQYLLPENGSYVKIIGTTFKIRIETESPDGKTPAEEIGFPKKATVTKGFKKKLKVRLDSYSTQEGFKWRSSNRKIATVDAKGYVKGKKAGNCNITCTLKNGRKYTCKLKVAPNVYNGYRFSEINVKKCQYGRVSLWINKACYKGSSLVVTCIAANNRIFSANKFNRIALALEASGNKVIAKKNFTNVGLNLGPFQKRTITFTFPRKYIKRKNYDLRDDYLQLWYRYVYEYQY